MSPRVGGTLYAPIAVDSEEHVVEIHPGQVTRGHLGVAVQEVSAPLAQSFELNRAHGALVSSRAVK